MTWRDNLRAASSEDGFIIAGGSGASMIPQNTNWHDNYMNSFTEDGIKIANLKDAVSQVETLPQEADTGSLYYLTTGANPGMYYYDGTQWVAVGGGGVSDFNDLTNRPQLNGTAMTGNTNITNFTGTDGTNAGAQGLVPAPAAADANKFLKADGTWATAGGGGGPTVVQTIGNSTTDVMSQNAVSSLIYADPTSQSKIWISSDNRRADARNDSICIGPSAYCSSDSSISIGKATWSGNGSYNIAIGSGAQNNNFSYQTWSNILIGTEARLSGSNAINGSLALGAYSGGNVTASGMVDFGSSYTNSGYNNTNYRLITGVHDAQNAHDAVTLGQLNALIAQLQSLGLNVSLQGASNAGQNSGSSEDPGTSTEPDPGVIAPTVTCPFCGQQTPADSTVCQVCGNDISGGATPDPGEEPGPEIPPEEPTEEPVEG